MSLVNENNKNEGGVLSSIAFIKELKVTRFEVFLLAATGILSGQVTAWNGATSEGFWVLMLACIINTIGYVILTSCIAEMTSALPFSGGIYGSVRAFTFPVLGFMVAVFELMMNLFYVSPVVYTLASLPVRSHVMAENMILPVCLFVYVVILFILIIGGKLFWLVNNVLGSFVLVLFLIYIIGSCTYADFDKWGHGKHGDSFNTEEFMRQIPLVSTTYLGMQLIPLVCRWTPEPKKDVPITMNISMIVFAFICFGLITTAVSQSPGIDKLTERATPLTYGFARIFNMSPASARWINIPILFATAYGFIFFCGRQASCMAKSALIPEAFHYYTPFFHTPYLALLTFTGLSFLLNIALFYDERIMRNMYLVTALSSFIVYIAALVGYIRFHKKYSSLERYFRSPFGVWGAYVGIAIFVCCFIGGALFQYDRFVAIGIILVTAALAFLYFLFFSGGQVFSEEEKQELFKAYLVNANLATKKRMQQKRKQIVPHAQTKSKHNSTIANFNSDKVPSRHEVQAAAVCDEPDQIQSPTLDTQQDIEKAITVSPSLLKRSFSQQVTGYLSSKKNRILPEPEKIEELQQLEILKAGGRFSHDLEETGSNIENV